MKPDKPKTKQECRDRALACGQEMHAFVEAAIAPGSEVALSPKAQRLLALAKEATALAMEQIDLEMSGEA